MPEQPRYKTTDEVDFVIIGSGAAGGVLAKELSTNGFRVVVLEQGPYLAEADLTHNEVTSGRGQTTLTVSALAHRAADRITALARHGEI